MLYSTLLPYKEPVKPLYGSSMVLQQFFGEDEVLYSITATHEEAIKSAIKFLNCVCRWMGLMQNTNFKYGLPILAHTSLHYWETKVT